MSQTFTLNKPHFTELTNRFPGQYLRRQPWTEKYVQLPFQMSKYSSDYWSQVLSYHGSIC